jgi:lipoate-protein ligase A
MYAVVLSYQVRPEVRVVEGAYRFVLGALAAALEPLVPGVVCRGRSDLAIGNLKFSGNSIRCKREHLLCHGTLLYDFSLGLIDRTLKMPPKEPAYRDGRPHEAFVTNLPLEVEAIRRVLVGAFDAAEPPANWPQELTADWPQELTARLLAEKYSRLEWNQSR